MTSRMRRGRFLITYSHVASLSLSFPQPALLWKPLNQTVSCRSEGWFSGRRWRLSTTCCAVFFPHGPVTDCELSAEPGPSDRAPLSTATNRALPLPSRARPHADHHPGITSVVYLGTRLPAIGGSARVIDGLRLAGSPGYRPACDRLTVCSCNDADKVNARFCRVDDCPGGEWRRSAWSAGVPGGVCRLRYRAVIQGPSCIWQGVRWLCTWCRGTG